MSQFIVRYDLKLIEQKVDMISVNFSIFRFAPAHFMGGTFCSCHRLKKRNFEKWFGLLRVVPICDICKKDFFDAYLEKQGKMFCVCYHYKAIYKLVVYCCNTTKKIVPIFCQVSLQMPHPISLRRRPENCNILPRFVMQCF